MNNTTKAKTTQEKVNNYWDELRSTNKWIVFLKLAEIFGGSITLLSLIWPFIPFTDADKHSSLNAAFALAGFVITSISSSVSDLWLKLGKDKLLAESILQEAKIKKE